MADSPPAAASPRTIRELAIGLRPPSMDDFQLASTSSNEGGAPPESRSFRFLSRAFSTAEDAARATSAVGAGWASSLSRREFGPLPGEGPPASLLHMPARSPSASPIKDEPKDEGNSSGSSAHAERNAKDAFAVVVSVGISPHVGSMRHPPSVPAFPPRGSNPESDVPRVRIISPVRTGPRSLSDAWTWLKLKVDDANWYSRRWLIKHVHLPGGNVLFPLLIFLLCAGAITIGLFVWQAASAVEAEASGRLLAAQLARASAAVEAELALARSAADFLAREAAALGSPPSPDDPRVAALLHSALLSFTGLPAAGLVLSADGSYAAAARGEGGAATIEVLSAARLSLYSRSPSGAASAASVSAAPAGAAQPALAALTAASAGGWARFADSSAGRWGVLCASSPPSVPSAAAFVGVSPAALSAALARAAGEPASVAALLAGSGDLLAASHAAAAPPAVAGRTALAAALAPLASSPSSEPVGALLSATNPAAGCGEGPRSDFTLGGAPYAASYAPVPAACSALGARVALGADVASVAGRVRTLVVVVAAVTASVAAAVLVIATCSFGELVRSMKALKDEIDDCGSFELLRLSHGPANVERRASSVNYVQVVPHRPSWVPENIPKPRSAEFDTSGQRSPRRVSRVRSILREIDSVGAALGKMQRAHAIVSAMRDAVVVVDTQHRITEFNPPAKVLFGLTHERFGHSDLGADPTHAISIIAPVDRARFADFLALHLAAATAAEERRVNGHKELAVLNRERDEWAAFGGRAAALRAIQGSASPGTGEFMAARFVGGASQGFHFPVEISVGQAHTARGTLQVLVIRDITERNRLLERVKVEEARSRAVAADLARLIDTANAPILAVDMSGRVVDWNKKMEELSGYENEEVLGRPLASLVDDDERPMLERILEDALHGAEQSNFEFSLVPSPNAAGTRRQVRLMMNASIRRSMDGELVGVLCIGQDITEKRRIIQVEAANAAKSRFLSYICHEIRTPLNGVLGFIQLLEDSRLVDEQKDWVRSIASCSEQLLAIVSQLLDLSKIEAGKVVLESTPLTLRDLVDDVVDSLAPQAYRKGVEVASAVSAAVDHVGRVLGDPTRLRQVLYNFLSNAIKFTEHGEVIASLDVVPAGMGALQGALTFRFSVRDSGIGIEEEALERLFSDFTQANPSIERRFGGTGMGLSICKQLVQLMGGSITVTSVPGQGSTFTFTAVLALAPAAGARAGGSPGQGQGGRRNSRAGTPPMSFSALQLPAPPAGGPRFLICHTNAAIAEVIRGCVAAVPGAAAEAEREVLADAEAVWARLEALAASGTLPSVVMVDEDLSPSPAGVASAFAPAAAGVGPAAAGLGLALARRLAHDWRFAKLRVVLMAKSRKGNEVAVGHGATVAILLKPIRLARVAAVLFTLAGNPPATTGGMPPSPAQAGMAGPGAEAGPSLRGIPSGASSFYARFSSPAASRGPRSSSSAGLAGPSAPSSIVLPPAAQQAGPPPARRASGGTSVDQFVLPPAAPHAGPPPARRTSGGTSMDFFALPPSALPPTAEVDEVDSARAAAPSPAVQMRGPPLLEAASGASARPHGTPLLVPAPPPGPHRTPPSLPEPEPERETLPGAVPSTQPTPPLGPTPAPADPPPHVDSKPAPAEAKPAPAEAKPAPAEAKPAASSDADEPLRVLIVDDVAMNQKVVASLLKKAGVLSDFANDGVEAVEKATARDEPYKLILMDIQMPRMDGLQATAKIREDEGGRPGRVRSAIVALTANSILGEDQQCREAGMDQVLTKPVRLNELLGALEQWTAWRRPAK